jgi:hypothetical protein
LKVCSKLSIEARLDEERGKSETRGGLRRGKSAWAPADVSAAAAMFARMEEEYIVIEDK